MCIPYVGNYWNNGEYSLTRHKRNNGQEIIKFVAKMFRICRFLHELYEKSYNTRLNFKQDNVWWPNP